MPYCNNDSEKTQGICDRKRGGSDIVHPTSCDNYNSSDISIYCEVIK